MKVGILTFHFGYNYGGVLQAFALQQFLNSCGHEVKIINYTPINFNTRPYWRQIISRNLSIDKTRKIIKKIQYGPKQKEAFHLFRSKYLHLTEKCSYEKLSEIAHEFDAIIVGSDQIWNPGQHKIGTYFLSHLDTFKGKRISYAPCCAINKVKEKNKNKLINALNKFDSISVRNKETEQFVFNLINKMAPIVVDPTLLWGFSELINEKPLINSKYILTYILGEEISGGHKQVIEKLKIKYPDTSVISIILTENKPQLFDWSDKTYWAASPEEWLNLFYHSSFIYTDSFHGALFSIKFKKPFLAYYTEEKRASRFIDLAKRFDDVEKNIVFSVNDALNKNTLNKEVDYKNLYKKLESEIDKSKIFLESSLSDEKLLNQ